MPSLKSFALLSMATLVTGTSMRARESQVPVVDVSVPSLNDSGSSEIPLGGKPVTEFVLRDSSGDNGNGSASLDHAKTSKDRTSSNTAALTQTGTVGHLVKYVNGSDLGEAFMVESSGGDIGTGAGRTSPRRGAGCSRPPGPGWRMLAGNGTIKGGIFTGTTAGSVPLVAIGAFSNHPLAFLTNGGTFSTIIDASGRIGVGTPNPQEKLDVLGNVRTVGSLISTVGTGTPPWW